MALLIGIDPGEFTGWAEYDPFTKKILSTRKLDFWSAIFEIDALKSRGVSIKVVVEDPNGNPTTFRKKYIHGNRAMVYEKISQNVGMNKREASLILRFLELRGIPRKAVVPSSGKLDAKAFQARTGYTKRISQHERDAALLVYGL